MELSPQQLVDCDMFSRGCDGGMAYNAYDYLTDHFAYLEEDYRYKAKAGDCKYNRHEAKSSSGLKLASYVCISPQSPAGMLPAVAQQPIAVSIDASSDVFQNYSSGVLDSKKCGTHTDHAVSIVGYGNDPESS